MFFAVCSFLGTLLRLKVALKPTKRFLSKNKYISFFIRIIGVRKTKEVQIMNNGESSYRRYLEGDKAAFEEVVRLYLDNLVFFIDRYVHDIYAAEDIAMDAFAYLLVYPGRYNFKTSLKTYLFMLGRSRAIDYIRRRSKLQFTELTGAEKDDFYSLEETVIADEAKRSLSRAIEELPPDMKAAVHLVYFEGQSYGEAGRVLKKNKKQIANLLSRAKVLLKDKLTKGEMFI